MQLDWPLMRENVRREDLEALREFLSPDKPIPRLTQGEQVRAFEEEFASWLGVRHAVFVNSGASANLITMAALYERHGPMNIAVPCITWVSDIAAVLQARHTPIFCDVHPETIGIDLSMPPLAHTAFVTHCLGFNAFDIGAAQGWPLGLIEDCCEATGAYWTMDPSDPLRKLGTFGLASNFSFYYAHHMSTIEGGMVCTDDADFYQTLRQLRSHGLVRERSDRLFREREARENPTLDPEFIFSMPAYNVRSTELNAVIGRRQLPRLAMTVRRRTENLAAFLGMLDPGKYRTRYRIAGSSNYALPLVLQEPDFELMERVVLLLKESGVECRRGTAGGGNQLRQPYAKRRWGEDYHKKFPQAEHIHQFGLYIGNYPDLEPWKIESLCQQLNAL